MCASDLPDHYEYEYDTQTAYILFRLFPFFCLLASCPQVMLTRDIAYGVLPKYSGPLDAFRTILVEEGALALFRGSVPAMWKSGASTAITFAVYEWVKAALAVD